MTRLRAAGLAGHRGEEGRCGSPAPVARIRRPAATGEIARSPVPCGH